MIAYYVGIWFGLDEPETRISFWHCSDLNIPEEVRDELKLDITPRFLIYYKGELKAEIKGAKFVELQEAINDHVPKLDED